MNKSENGVWGNTYTTETRLFDEWPASTIAAIGRVTTAAAHTQRVPVILQIGPSSLKESPIPFPETYKLLELAHPSTRLIALEVNDSIYLELEDHFKYSAPVVSTVYGNGWEFRQILEEHFTDQNDEGIHLSLIIAANNLSAITENMQTDDAVEYIGNFLFQAREMLHPQGEILIVSGYSSLRMRLTQHGTVKELTVPYDGCVETYFYRTAGPQIGQKVASSVWHTWIHALQTHGVVFDPEFQPQYRDITTLLD